MTAREANALKALRTIDFQWTVHVDSVWSNPKYHVPDLHASIAENIGIELDELKYQQSNKSPTGWVLTGAGGSGKTHLLQTLRKEAAAGDVGFVFVDMTGVHNFWDTILLAYLDSLQKPYVKGVPQYYLLLEHLINIILKGNMGSEYLEKMATLSVERTIDFIDIMIEDLAKIYRGKILKYQDTIRALVLLHSADFSMSSVGYSWLQGLGVNGNKKFGFMGNQQNSKDIVEALSWLMSLKGPVILAMDQMDAIVTQHHLASGASSAEPALDEQQVARSIIAGIGGGLSALRDVTRRTLIVVSCLEATWDIIETTLSTNVDRYHPAIRLKKIGQSVIARKMVELRLRAAFRKHSFQPRYTSWPFKEEAFEITEGMLPRQVLQNCEKYRQKWLVEKKISECQSLAIGINVEAGAENVNDYGKINDSYNYFKPQANLATILAETREDHELATLLEVVCRCLQKEISLPDNVDMLVDQDFAEEKSYRYLHVRMRLVYREENEREEHFCLRAILKSHAIAYQSRLKAAITTAGIDRNLPFRRLVIIRIQEIPAGEKTRHLTETFKRAGGLFATITDDELRSMWALHQLAKQNDPMFELWLKSYRPISRLKFMQLLCPELCGNVNVQGGQPSAHEAATKTDYPNQKTPRQKTTTAIKASKASASRGSLTIGRRLKDSTVGEEVGIPIQELSKHTVVLAGSGSGKTVLVRRMVEEAALAGIPSIVIDCANDLTLLGDAWPQQPSSWLERDTRKAKKYHQRAEVVVWTPGIERGNPLKLEPLPDLSALKHDADELEQAIGMVRDALQPIVAPGESQKANYKRGILHAALEYFVLDDRGGLPDFIELLADIPSGAGGGITNAEKLALEMADSLRAQMQTDILLKQSGQPLDPARLFGAGATTERTRISVINFTGLPALASQQQFLNQLAMTLFSWIKKYPAPVASPLRGLLVIDEAKDFIPAGKSVSCKNSILRLAAQARKYGLGLVFATQAPKSVDHNIIANCSTHFYGQANSPAAIDAVKSQIKARGGSGEDVARLGEGKFYFYSEKTTRPIKIKAPMCLSYHPPTPPQQEEIIKRAGKKW